MTAPPRPRNLPRTSLLFAFLCALCAVAPVAPFAAAFRLDGNTPVAAQGTQGTQGAADAPALVLGVGDSLMFGVGSSLPATRGEYALFLDLARGRFGPNLRAANVAVPGTTSTTLLASPRPRANFPGTATPIPVIPQIERARAELRRLPEGAGATVLLSIGGNDLVALRGRDDEAREIALATYRTNLDAAFAALTGDGRTRQLLIQTIYNPEGGDPTVQSSDAALVERFNDALREVARTRPQVAVVELAQAVRGAENDLTMIRYGDIHLSNSGHRLAADLLWAASGADRVPPEVTLLAPATGNAARPVMTVRVVVTDNSGANGVARVALLVDGAEGPELFARPDLGANTFLGIWDGRLAPGPHTLGVFATDRAGNRRDAAVPVTVGATP